MPSWTSCAYSRIRYSGHPSSRRPAHSHCLGPNPPLTSAPVDFSLFVDQIIFAGIFFQLNRDWNRVFQGNRRLFVALFPNTENAEFSFKSATKIRSQMTPSPQRSRSCFVHVPGVSPSRLRPASNSFLHHVSCSYGKRSPRVSKKACRPFNRRLDNWLGNLECRRQPF
jgi:hypothetical protein